MMSDVKCQMSNVKSRGFTLIELMVVLSITAVLGTIGIAGFRSYSQIQIFESSVNDFTTALNTARSRALSQVKPPSQCGSGDTLDGYKIKILSNAAGPGAYEVFLVCSRSDLPVELKYLAKDISFADADHYKEFFFPTLTGAGGAKPTPEQVTISGYGRGRIVSVNSLGGVSVQ